jgi:hypothetical protein
MIKLSAISPKTLISMGGSQGVSSPEEMQLKSLLEQMAYSMLESKAPNLMSYVTSFKPIEFDIDSNRAVGAFSLNINGVSILIPIVMSSGKVKSPEVFYDIGTDTYLPLEDGWIKEVQSKLLNSLGAPSKAPPGLSSDVDIRALTLPPTTGRFVYASLKDVNKIDVKYVLSVVDNNTKVAFANTLRSNKEILKSFIKYHGSSSLQYLKPTYYKTSSASNTNTEICKVLTPSSNVSEFKKYFGKHSEYAFQESCVKGYVTIDTRKHASILVDSEMPLSSTTMARSGITEPKSPGVYNIVSNNGTVSKVVIIPKVYNADACHTASDAFSVVRGVPKEYLVIDEKNRVGVFKNIIALYTTEKASSFTTIKSAMLEDEPANGDKLFLSILAGEVTSAVYFNDGITRVVINEDHDSTAMYQGDSVTFTKSSAIKNPRCVKKQDGSYSHIVPNIFYPANVSSEKLDQSDFISDPAEMLRFVNSNLVKLSSEVVRVKKANDSTYTINGINSGDIASTLVKIGSLGINVTTSSNTVSGMQDGSSKLFYNIPIHNVPKLASIFGPDNQQQGQSGGMPPEQMGGMPMQPGMPPEQMGGMPMQPGMPPEQMGGMPMQPGMPPQSEQAMQDAANLNDQDTFNAAMTGSLLSYNQLNESIAGEVPKIEKALDGSARILVSVQMREDDLVAQIGQQGYSELENNLKKVLSSLGKVVLTLTKQRNMSALPEGSA